VATYTLEFYEDEHGDAPVRRWLRDELTAARRQALGYAMQIVLQRLGVAVCWTEFGNRARVPDLMRYPLPPAVRALVG
jgi:hypothetical protein